MVLKEGEEREREIKERAKSRGKKRRIEVSIRYQILKRSWSGEEKVY